MRAYYEDESDNDSIALSQDFSPTDGYFRDRGHPQEVYQEQAGSSTCNGDAKTQHVSHASPPSSSESDNVSVRPYRAQVEHPFHTERSPLLGILAAPPPTYADAMGSAPRYDYTRMGRGLRTSESSDAEERTGFLFNHGRQPESMDPPRDSGDEEGLYVVSPEKRTWKSWISRPVVKIALGVILVFVVLLALLAALRPSAKKLHDAPAQTEPDTEEPEPVEKEPQPHIPPLIDGQPVPMIPWPSYCGAKPEPFWQTVKEFNDGDFLFSDSVEGSTSTSVFGETHVIPAPASQSANIVVNVTITVSGINGEALGLHSTETDYAIEVQSNKLSTANLEKGCTYIFATLSMKPGLSLTNFDIDSRNTKVVLHDTVDISVTGLTSMSLTSGSLYAAFFQSRQTKIDVVSGSIAGTFSLLDRLTLKTTSGSINAYVKPGDADPKAVRPAALRVHSHMGSIHIEYDLEDLPDRDYQTHVDAELGLLEGVFVHGSETQLSTRSGSMKAELTPYNASTPSTLSTNTMSGSTKITVHSPYANPNTPLSSISSNHVGQSGSLMLSYPQEWTGRMDGGTRSGSLVLEGKDVRIVERNDRVPGRHVVAEKGDGASRMNFSTQSGSCRVQVGEVIGDVLQ